MSSENIIVRSQAHIYLAGPPLVLAATGEVVTSEALGGAAMHCSISGVTDHLAEDDAHALALARRAVTHWNFPSPPPLPSSFTFSPPLYPAHELRGLTPLSLRRPLPAHELIARLVDGSLFCEFKPLFGATLVTGFAAIHGHAVGILASNGPLHSDSALKATHFIQLCTQRRIPLIFLQNISGFMVGEEAERGGIAKHGAKMVTAVACADVPKFTVVVGGSFGAGNYGMCGRAFGPRLLVGWPGARTGVMGGEQVEGVMRGVGGGEKGQEKGEGLRERMERESRAVFGSARGWDDGLVLPERTREVLALGLEMARKGRWVEREMGARGADGFGVFRM
jgi:3-methylcrotonyl-CoA carboxylase beta subunit